MIMFAFSFAKARQVAFPIPLLPSVIRTVCPAKSTAILFVSLFLSNYFYKSILNRDIFLEIKFLNRNLS